MLDIFEYFNSLNIEKLLEKDIGEINVSRDNETNLENPFCCVYDWLFINEQLIGTKYVEDIIVKIIKKSNLSEIYIDDSFINPNTINEIINNKNITTITLGNNFSLSKELYEKIKNSHIKEVITTKIDKELEGIYDPLIGYTKKALISSYNYYQLQKGKIILTSPINDVDFDNIKYIEDELEIKLNLNDKDLIKFITEIKKNNKKSKIIINVEDKIKFNNVILNNTDIFKDLNLFVILEVNEYDINKYIEYEKRLQEMIEPALNLSQLEKYLYAYNKVKQFKEYKENEENLSSSRNIYDILDNEYMVCVGYSKLLVDLLSRLGINAGEFSNNVNIGHDGISRNQIVAGEEKTEHGGHARVQVRIVDPKYNVDGIYIADPTWDNDMKNDLYLHALMTRNEYNSLNRENYMSYNGLDEILSSTSYEEFSDRLNYFVSRMDEEKEIKNKRFLAKNISELDNKIEKENCNFNKDTIYEIIYEYLRKEKNINTNYFLVNGLTKDEYMYSLINSLTWNYKFKSTETKEQVLELIRYEDERIRSKEKNKKEDGINNYYNILIEFLQKFDKKYLEELEKKYGEIAKKGNRELMEKELYDIGNYIVSKNNNSINMVNFMSAVKNIYLVSGLTKEEANEKLTQTIKINKKLFERSYPKREISNGENINYLNSENRFEELDELSKVI